MPAIEKRTAKDGIVTYRAKIRVKGFPPQSASFQRKTDASRWAARIESEIRAGKYFPETKSKGKTVADLLDAYEADLRVRNPKRYADVQRMITWWRRELGCIGLQSIHSADILKQQQRLLSRKKQRRDEDGEYATFQPATVNRYTVVLHRAFGFAIHPLGWITTNPAAGIPKLKEPPGRTRYLSPDEIERLVSACKESKNPLLLSIVVVGMASGVRREELENMTWEDVNVDCSRIRLPVTKNGKVRGAFITGAASRLLAQMREKQGNSPFVFPSSNDPTRHVDFESAWRAARARAKIEDFHFHDLRHTCASYLAMNGASLLEIAEVLGHQTLQMVKRYAHLAEGHTSTVAARMTERMFANVEI